MKAIVLTCDKYTKFTEHMVLTYTKIWPSHPFTFRVPYGDDRSILDKYGSLVEPIQTDAAKLIYPIETQSGTKRVSLIRNTILTLLEDLDDDEWFYWCMDDKYLIDIKEEEANDVYKTLLKIDDPSICCIQLLRHPEHIEKRARFKFIPESKILSNPNLLETDLTEKTFLADIWPHQFYRVKVIRRFFQSLPDTPFQAKTMDTFPWIKEKGEKVYVVEKNLIVMGESTRAGKITENCMSSFKKWGLEIPEDFPLHPDKIYYVLGELPYRFFGLEIEPPRKLRSWMTQLQRWYWRNKSI